MKLNSSVNMIQTLLQLTRSESEIYLSSNTKDSVILINTSNSASLLGTDDESDAPTPSLTPSSIDTPICTPIWSPTCTSSGSHCNENTDYACADSFQISKRKQKCANNKSTDFLQVDQHILYMDYRRLFRFNNKSVNSNTGNILFVSDTGFSSGYFKWSFEIIKTDIYLQEIGIVGTSDIENVTVGDNGIKHASALGARAVYGNELSTGSEYYTSYDENNKQRCFKDIKNTIGWCEGDIITVVLNLNVWKVKFLLNGKRVRKVLSLQPNREYHPCISFKGKCQFGMVPTRY